MYIRNIQIKCWLDGRYDNEGKEKVERIQMSSLKKKERKKDWKESQDEKP